MTGAAADKPDWRLAACWIAGPGWVLLNAINAAAPDLRAGGLLAGLSMLVMLAFVAIHASLAYGWRGCATYFAVAVGLAFALEACSIATGFPFGFYRHLMPGPKPLGVPFPVMIGYAWLGWFAWSIARLVTREVPTDATGRHRFTTPLLTAFILAGFDLAFDPIGSTATRLYEYRHPGGLFGVPLSNFLGWIFTGWVIFQAWALVEHRFAPAGWAVRRRDYWLLPCLVWIGSALQFPLLLANAPAGLVTVADRTFVIRDIYETAVIAALLTMVPAGLAGAIRATRPRLGEERT